MASVSLARGKASLASPSSHSNRPSFQNRPPVRRDPFRSPSSLWAGTSVTNSAQGVDYASQSSLWLASHLLLGSHSPPPRPYSGPSARDGTPEPPPDRAPRCSCGKAPACSVPRRNWLPGHCCCLCAARGPHASPAPGRPRSREKGCAPSSHSGLRVPLTGSGTSGRSKASRAGLRRDRPSLTL